MAPSEIHHRAWLGEETVLQQGTRMNHGIILIINVTIPLIYTPHGRSWKRYHSPTKPR